MMEGEGWWKQSLAESHTGLEQHTSKADISENKQVQTAGIDGASDVM